MLRILDLFSGIGGISLGLERTGGFVTSAFCEIEPFCRCILAHHWPEVPIYEDIRSLAGGSFRGRIDIVVGGFPCQDVSVAGKGAGVDAGSRSGLWREMFRLIREIGPAWVLTENVPALRTRGGDRVLGDLESLGYSCWPLVVGARHVGATHRRDRVWIVAHRDGDGLERSGRKERLGEETRLADSPGNIADGCGELAVAERDRRERPRSIGELRRKAFDRIKKEIDLYRATIEWPARPGEPQHEWEEARLFELSMGSSTDGLSPQLVRRWNRNTLKAAGNSVVPQVVEMIGRAILAVSEED